MKHSIKLVDDQMNWCDSAIEVLSREVVSRCLSSPRSHISPRPPHLPTATLLAGNTRLDSFQAAATMREKESKSSPSQG